MATPRDLTRSEGVCTEFMRAYLLLNAAQRVFGLETERREREREIGAARQKEAERDPNGRVRVECEDTPQSLVNTSL